MAACYERHKKSPGSFVRGPTKGEVKPSPCDATWRYTKCCKTFSHAKESREKHKCDFFNCKQCGNYVEKSHVCYLRPPKPGPGNEGNTKKKPASKQIYFDYEACTDVVRECVDGYKAPSENLGCRNCRLQGGGKCLECLRCVNCSKSRCSTFRHIPNLVVAQTSCDSCKHDPFNPDSSKCSECGSRCQKCSKLNANGEFTRPLCADCGHRDVRFDGFGCSDAFAKWILQHYNKNFVGEQLIVLILLLIST